MNKYVIRDQLRTSIKEVEVSILKAKAELSRSSNMNEKCERRLNNYLDIAYSMKKLLPYIEECMEKEDKHELYRLCNLLVQMSNMVQEDVPLLLQEVYGIPKDIKPPDEIQ